MLTKQAWRLLTKANPLGSQVMYPKTDFLGASLGDNPSYVWRSILEAKAAIKQGCTRRIGDG